MLEGLRQELEAAESKSELSGSGTARLTPLAKVVQQAQQMRRRHGSSDGELESQLAQFEAKVRTRHREIQLENLIDAAKKAQFKGQTKKAIDGYREVLYVLKNDPVPDTQQEHEIAALERLIGDLEAPGR